MKRVTTICSHGRINETCRLCVLLALWRLSERGIPKDVIRYIVKFIDVGIREYKCDLYLLPHGYFYSKAHKDLPKFEFRFYARHEEEFIGFCMGLSEHAMGAKAEIELPFEEHSELKSRIKMLEDEGLEDEDLEDDDYINFFKTKMVGYGIENNADFGIISMWDDEHRIYFTKNFRQWFDGYIMSKFLIVGYTRNHNECDGFYPFQLKPELQSLPEYDYTDEQHSGCMYDRFANIECFPEVYHDGKLMELYFYLSSDREDDADLSD